MTTILEKALDLSVEEKLQLISALWDSMSDHPENIPIADWQLEELERRIANQRDNPEQGQTWEEVKHEILQGKT